jgi:tetratricopeptide (TPR) repeat protein
MGKRGPKPKFNDVACSNTKCSCYGVAGPWHNKGDALYYQSKYDEAIKAYDEAIRLDPNDATVWTTKVLLSSCMVALQKPKQLSPRPRNWGIKASPSFY